MNTNLKKSNGISGVLGFLKREAVSVIFIVLAIVFFLMSGMKFSYVLSEVLLRLAQNSFLVLALIIPVIAGMGLNFSITVGAMASQIALFLITFWSNQTGSALFTGVPGFILAIVITVPLSILFGTLAGKLLNKTKGQEMIAGMILGYFANGIYMFIFLILFGGLIPMADRVLMISGGVGVKNTFDVSVAGALDDLFSTRLGVAVPLLACVFALALVAQLMEKKSGKKGAMLRSLPAIVTGILMVVHAIMYSKDAAWVPYLRYVGLAITLVFVVIGLIKGLPKKQIKTYLICALILVLLLAAITFAMLDQFTSGRTPLRTFLKINVPVSTYVVIALLCLVNTFIFKTKIGQSLRTVGQSMSVATASGIHVDKIRIFAIVLSTIFAGIGQLIYLQSIGVMQTYSAHTNVSLYSIAALLVGGASVNKANNKQALFGVLIFHTILVVLPNAVGQVFSDSQHTEYFRAFLLYSVICFSLISHAVSTRKKVKANAENENAAPAEEPAVEETT